MRYAASKLSMRRKDAAYRIYVTDCLRLIGESVADVAKAHGGEGRYVATRYADLAHRKPQVEETRTGAEIIADLRRKLAVE